MMKARVFLTCTILCTATAIPVFAVESASGLVARGNRLYVEKKYGKAELLYKDAQKLLPESPEINFNLGNVSYRKKDYDAAEDYFSKVAESADAGRALRKKALYNLGNCAFMRGEKLLDADLQKALDNYRLSILRYQDVIRSNEYSREHGVGEAIRSDEDAKYNIEVARLKVKDILDRLKQEAEKRKQQQKQQEEFIEKLKEAIEKQEQIVKDTDDARARKERGEDISESTEDVKKRQAENKERTKELAEELNQRIEAAKSQGGGDTQKAAAVDENAVGAQGALKDAEIEQGTALQHLDQQDLTEAKNREQAALQNLQDALAKLTKPQPPQPQPGEQPQQNEQAQRKEQQQKKEQSGKEQKKEGEDQEKMTPQQAQEELAKLRKQANDMRKEELEKFLRQRPNYRQQRRKYEPVDKDW